MTDDEKRELVDVYEKAAGRLERSDECIWAGIFYASGDLPLAFRAGQLASEVLELGGQVPALFKWNDDPTRTKDEVINVLHGLANKLR